MSLTVNQNKAGTGSVGKADFEVTEGEHGPKEIGGEMKNGKRVTHYFNITNKSPLAVQISQKQLDNLLLASGSRSTFSSLGFDTSRLVEEIGDNEFIVEVEKIPEFKDKDGNYIKADKKRRAELNGLDDEDLASSGITKVFSNKISSFKAA